MSIKAYGRNIGIRVSDEAVLSQLVQVFPPGWEVSDQEEVEMLYSFKVGGAGKRKGVRHYNLLYAGSGQLVRTHDMDEVFDTLRQHLSFLVATSSTEGFFIHGGVVGWQDQAIVILGPEGSGRTTLVKELVKAGASYYSDQYAVLNEDGHVLPYLSNPATRNDDGQYENECLPEQLGEVGTKPLPVGLALMTTYENGAHWQVRPVSVGQAMLAWLEYAVVTRFQPEDAMMRIQKVVTAPTFRSKRGEAADVASKILAKVSEEAG
ncbi:MAG: hypothetical protein AAF629_19575 [Chloroflexota bacterium]